MASLSFTLASISFFAYLNSKTILLLSDSITRSALPFDEFYKKKVFSTWSVNSFFQSIIENKFVDFGDYWYDNGGLPSILVNYLKTHKLNALDYVEKDKTITIRVNDFKNPTSLTSINQNVLMCQTGYLTLRSPVYSKGFMTLGIPNSEVYNSLPSR